MNVDSNDIIYIAYKTIGYAIGGLIFSIILFFILALINAGGDVGIILLFLMSVFTGLGALIGLIKGVLDINDDSQKNKVDKTTKNVSFSFKSLLEHNFFR
jgi:hypothetical protein